MLCFLQMWEIWFVKLLIKEGDIIMEALKQQAIELRKSIKWHEKEMDNPALMMGILNELDFFIENLKV